MSISAFIGASTLMGWLAHAQPEPIDYASLDSAKVVALIDQRPEIEALPVQARSKPAKDTAKALRRKLLWQARRGKIRPSLLLATFIEQEAAHGGGDAKRLMDEFRRRSTFKGTYLHPIDQLAGLKAQMVSGPDLVYVSNAYSFTEVLLADRLQCQSTSMTIALAWLQQKTTQRAGSPRPVLVLSMNHVQPGLLYEGALHLMEGTSRGDRVAKLHLADLGDVRVLDAADALTWTLLQNDTPARIKDRMMIFNNHDGGRRFRIGSGSNSWLHLPLTFGKRIVLTSTARPLAKNTNPARMLIP